MGDAEQAKKALVNSLMISSEIKATAISMTAICGFGRLFESNYDYLKTIELFHFVECSAENQSTKKEASQALQRLSDKISAKDLEAVHKRVHTMTIESVTRELIGLFDTRE